jgi:hypothetical protein
MDNGLIFPYRRKTAHTKPVMLTARSLTNHPCGVRFLAERGTRAGEVSVLTGVTQEGSQAGRWLSRSKDVGRTVGKSAVHVPEI